MAERIGGIIRLQIDGEVYRIAGVWTRNLGVPMREELIGSEEVHGFKETARAPFLEGAMRDSGDLDLRALQSITGATVTMEMPNGKLFVLYDAFYSGEGNISSEEGEITARFVGMSAEEIAA